MKVIFAALGAALLFLLLSFYFAFNSVVGYSLIKKVIPDSIEQGALYRLTSFSKELDFSRYFKRGLLKESQFIDLYFSKDDLEYIENKKKQFLELGYIKDEINDWREAQIRVDNKKYNMSYKFQGTSVSSIDRYSANSYKIKLKKKNPYYESARRFVLINYLEEASIATTAVNSFALKFGLLGYQSRLVGLRINGVVQEEPFFIYEDRRDEWLERTHRITNYTMLKPNDDWDRKEPSHQAMTDLYAEGYEYFGTNDRPELAVGKLRQLLKAVRDEDIEGLKSMLDLDYAARFVAFSTLVNNSHPVYGDNLRLLYDFVCGCFRIVYRLEDDVLRMPGAIEDFNSNWLNSIQSYKGAKTFQLFELLLKDRDFRRQRDHYLHSLVVREDDFFQEFAAAYDRNMDVVAALAHKTTELNSRQRNFGNLAYNFERVKNYLNYGKIFATYNKSKRTLNVICDSFQELRIESLISKNGKRFPLQYHCLPELEDDLTIAPRLWELSNIELPSGFELAHSRPFFSARIVDSGKIIEDKHTYLTFTDTDPHNQALLADIGGIVFNHKKKLISIRAGVHRFEKTIVLPAGYSLTIEKGTTLLLGDGASILVQGSLIANGTQEKPIFVKGMNGSTFGSFAINGVNQAASVVLKHFNIEGGSEAYINGAQFLGQLSIYNVKLLEADYIDISGSVSDDGLNVKNAEVRISNSKFYLNDFDQVDLDYCTGFIRDSIFLNNHNLELVDGDGLDLSGSDIQIVGNSFEGFRDKGLSIGELTNVGILNNRIVGNNTGIAVKDGSVADLAGNEFSDNQIDISAFIKKKFYPPPVVRSNKASLKLTIKLADGATLDTPSDSQTMPAGN